MSWPRRLFIVGGILVALAALVVPPAFAKDYHISAARVEVEVGPDGTVEVTEHISFDFNGSFEGAYRDIPIRTGEQVLDVIVSEGATVFTPDAPTELGSSGAPSLVRRREPRFDRAGGLALPGERRGSDFHGVIPDDGTRRRLRRRRRCLSPGMG